MLLTLDSSIFVSAIREPEESHQNCKKLLAMLAEGKHEAIEPFTVLIEVASAIKRRTGLTNLAKEVKTSLLAIDTITFEELVRSRADEAANLAINTGLRGMDAIIVQTAIENQAYLVSLDSEMLELVKGKVKIKRVSEIL